MRRPKQRRDRRHAARDRDVAGEIGARKVSVRKHCREEEVGAAGEIDLADRGQRREVGEIEARRRSDRPAQRRLGREMEEGMVEGE